MGLIRHILHGKHSASRQLPKARRFRLASGEPMEPRCVLSVSPIQVGAVYVEQDSGSDAHGDTFLVSFEGGADKTQLDQIVIDGDQVFAGFGVGDAFFDVSPGGLGADGSFDFTIVDDDQIDSVKATVEDGGLRLVLEFTGFDAGDEFVFSIDVDEVEAFDPTETNPEYVNDGIDPITSGVEFQGSHLTAAFTAPGYFDIESTAEFRNRYDEALAESGLALPPDNAEGKQDRSAGAFDEIQQQYIPASIAGRVQLSTRDGDCFGEQEDHEPVEGAVVQLYDGAGNLVAETLTDANGEYFFGELAPGSYRVVEITPDDLLDGGAAPGMIDGEPAGMVGDDGAVSIDLTGGESVENVDFCEHEPATIEGKVYHDRDNDGRRDAGEEGIAGVVIQLLDQEGNVVAETLTDENGCYKFEGVEAGKYDIREIHPTDWIDGIDTPGEANGAPTGVADNPGDVIRCVEIGWGDQGVEFNFGELQAASISGRVQLATRDGDCFGETESHEGIPDVRIVLLDANGDFVAETFTDADGFYRFEGLLPGTYSLVEETPVGLNDGESQAGSVDGETNGDAIDGNTIEGIMLGSGDDGTDYLFCEEPPVTLEGKVYHDRDDDGIREPGEEGIAGVLIQLLDQDGNVVAEAVTDENGCYKFEDVPPGKYDIRQIQPTGWLDGQDSPGEVNGEKSGQAENPGDIIRCVELRLGDEGKEFNFGELKPGTITGLVHSDIVRDCTLDPAAGEEGLAGVTIELLDADGNVVATTVTDELGEYRFDNVKPGKYSLRQIQPADYFDAGWNNSRSRGDGNRIGGINVWSGQTVAEQNFCEVPPGKLSGFVFQDGAPVELAAEEVLPERIAAVRNGQRTPDDTPLRGVQLQLRDGITGRVIDGSEALPGTYDSGPVIVRTNRNGFYQFVGLPPGSYSVYQVQPTNFIDGVDTPGTTFGFVFNPGEPINTAVLQQLEVDPQNNAIARISLPPGTHSIENNFSEIVVDRLPAPPPPPPLVPPLLPPPVLPEIEPPEWVDTVQILNAPALPSFVVESFGDGSASPVANTWHLSVIDGGRPRGQGFSVTEADNVWMAKQRKSKTPAELRQGQWDLPSAYATFEPGEDKVLFGLAGAIPFSADFNGDGFDEIGVFLQGDWFIDINANGKWDEEDLWARLGDKDDLPVTGDWDGDGKADIGIFGRAWAGDAKAIAYEPGLPDSENTTRTDQKNLPPERKKATSGERVMQLSSRGKKRADIIDHVFLFGSPTDVPLAADWNGDGIASIGVFRSGKWHVDVNGDGKWTEADREYQFGQAGDQPLTGDFDGDGVDDIAVYREGKVYLDSNGNRKLDAADTVLAKGQLGHHAVAGDWNGDGVDEIATYQGTKGEVAREPSADAEPTVRTAMKDAG